MTEALKFGIKGVFCMRTKFNPPNGKPDDLVFEERIINITAKDESEAIALAHQRFSSTVWTAVRPIDYILHQEQAYLGISRVVELGLITDKEEVWYEFVDECPDISIPAPDASS